MESQGFSLENSIKCLKLSKSMLFLGDKFGNLYIKHKTLPDLSAFQTSVDMIESSESTPISINKLEILKSSENRAIVLTSIDKSIKTFKIFPQPGQSGQYYTGSLESSLEGVHECSINSLSLCSNQSNFISSDDLNLFLWDTNRTDQVCHIVNHKETTNNEINEVITSAKFHPSKSSEFLWTSTNGTVRLGDLRMKLIMDKPVSFFKYVSSSSWIYEDLVQSISCAEFCRNHESVVARDYFTVKFWDLRSPVLPYLVSDVVEDRNLSMRDICENQEIYYEFEVRDYCGDYAVTGGQGKLYIINRKTGEIKTVKTEKEDTIVLVDVWDDYAVFASESYLGFCNLDTN